jgi:drug/metabolite transporter (DMT)-like permease
LARNAPSSSSTAASPPPASPGLTALDVILLGSLGILWGSAYIFIREGIVFGASPIEFAAVRYGLSAAAFAALAAARRERLPNQYAVLVSGVVGGTLIIGAYGGFLYWGEQYTTGGYAAILASTAPILTVVFAYSLLPAERLGAVSLLGILVGFVGVVVLVVPEIIGSPVGTWPGPLFLFLAFVSAAIGTVVLRRVGRGPQGLWQIGVQFGVGGALLGIVALALPVRETLPLTLDVWASLLALVVFASVMGYFVYFQLHHRVGPVQANIVAYLVPLVGIGIGTGFFAEPVTLSEVAGFLIVIVGVTLVIRGSMQRSAATTVAGSTR